MKQTTCTCQGAHPRRPSPALILSIIGVILGLVGSATAATTLIRSSSQIKNGVVKSADIDGKTLKSSDLSPQAIDQLGARWAHVTPTGSIESQSGGINVSSNVGDGNWELDFGSDVSGRAMIASPSALYSGDSYPLAASCEDQDIVCLTGEDGSHVKVNTYDTSSQVLADRGFYITVLK